MATLALDITAGTADRITRTYTLDGVSFQLEVWWDALVTRWQASVTRPGTDFAVRGVYLSPGAPLFVSAHPDAPAGTLTVVGRDPYVRDDLGTSRLRLVYEEAG